jgi:hypothetical protein
MRFFSCGNVLQPESSPALPASKMAAAGSKPVCGLTPQQNGGKAEEREDLMQIPGPITEAAIVKTLAARFQAQKYQVIRS